jgi:Na+/melibiose symporter-like transporter
LIPRIPLEQQLKGMKYIILGQAWGMILSALILQTPIPTLIALKLGASKFDVFLAFTCINLAGLVGIPASYYIDFHRRRPFLLRFWTIGTIIALGMISAPFFSFLPAAKADAYIFLGFMIVFWTIISVGNAAWFPLLKDIVTPSKTGIFFSRMRLAWQTVGFIFVILVTLFLRFGGGNDGELWQYQLILLFAFGTSWVRIYYISKLPEAPFYPPPKRPRFTPNFRAILRNREFRTFTGYNIFVGVFNSFAVQLLIFFMVDLNYSDSLNIFITATATLGTLIGLTFSGILVRNIGCNRAFFLSHLLRLGIFLLTFGIWNASLISILMLFFISFTNGIINSIYGVAHTVKIFQITPKRNRSLFLSLSMGIVALVCAFPPIIMGLLVEEWLPLTIPLLGIDFYRYHYIFAGSVLYLFVSLYFVKFLPKDSKRII